MPIRIYKAYTQHVSNNLWLWITISTAAMVVLAVIDRGMPRGQGLGNWVALAGAVLGILLMLKSEGEMPERVLVAPDAG